MGDIVLEILLRTHTVLVLEAEFSNLRLTMRAFFPFHFRALVPTYVEKFSGEDVSNFAEHLVKEAVGLVLACTEHLVCNTPNFTHLVRAAGASEFRIGCQSCNHMTGQVYFRDYGDTELPGIIHHLPQLLLSVVTPVRNVVITVPVASHHCAGTHTAHLGEFRIFLAFYAPALVVGEVPVKTVEFVGCHSIEQTFYIFNRKEMTGTVQHHSPVGIGGRVLNFAEWDGKFGIVCL